MGVPKYLGSIIENTKTLKTPSHIDTETKYIDTGSYMLNAQYSGTIYGGIKTGQIFGMSGESTTGKTYLSVCTLRNWLKLDKDNHCLWVNTEGQDVEEFVTNLGVDYGRITEVKTKSIETIIEVLANVFDAIKKGESNKIMIIIDSYGMMVTDATVDNQLDGTIKGDMGRTTQRRNELLLSIADNVEKYNILCMITNHIYTNVGGYGEAQKETGGEKWKFVPNQRAWLRKKVEKETEKGKADKVVRGINLNSTMKKSRVSTENTIVHTYISYKKGLSRFGGVLEKAVEYGMIEKNGGWYNYKGNKFQISKLAEKAGEIFTKDFLDEFDQHIREEYKYGINSSDGENDEC